MILADTVVWADHLGRGDARLAELLTQGQFLMHPYVLGELALGNLPRRVKLLRDLSLLQYLALPRHSEVMSLIEARRLFGSGVGYVDAHLIAAVLLTDRCELWSRDKRLVDVTKRLGIAFQPASH